MNILLVIDGILYGGGARVFLQLATGLIGREHNVLVACVPDGEVAPLLRQADIPVLPVSFAGKNPFSIINQLQHHIRRHNIDIVNSQGGRVDFYSRITAKLCGAQSVSTVAMLVDSYDVPPMKKAVYMALDRFSEKFANHFAVVSNSLKKTLHKKHGIPESKITTVYNGIELAKYQPDAITKQDCDIRKTFGLPGDTMLIGTVGRLVWQKGYEYLIRAVPGLIKEGREIKIMIVGEGILHDKLQQLARDLRVDEHIIFTGFRDDIKELLNSFDIFVVSSLLEGFPMVILEAMAMAKPIVATSIDGITEQIADGQDGLLVPATDHKAITKALDKLIDDKEMAATLGAEARLKAKRCFSVEKMILETEKVLTSLL